MEHAPDRLNHDQLIACLELGKSLASELDSDKLFTVFLEKVSVMIPAANWSLLLRDEKTDELYFHVTVGVDHQLMEPVRLRLGEGIAGRAAESGLPLIVEDVSTCPHFHGGIDELTGFQTRSLICLPLKCGDRVIGVLEVVNPASIDVVTQALLEIIADYAAIAVENTRRYHQIKELAVRDNVTGLYNTRYLYQAIMELQAATATFDNPFSIVFMDMDNFKRTVDTYGHLNGTRALQEVAVTIRESLTRPCFGVSYGGDEFLAVLPGFSKAQAVEKAQEIREKMCATVYLSRWGHAVQLRASYGVATCPDDAHDLTELLALADHAMFGVKKRGKDAVGTG